MRGEWRSAITTSGAQSVTTSLVLLKHELFAGSLVTPLLVSIVGIQDFFFFLGRLSLKAIMQNILWLHGYSIT